MIKIGILILAFFALSSAVTFENFRKLTTDTCKEHIKTCMVDFYNDPNVGDEQIECYKDLQKARVCTSSYKQCFPADNTPGASQQEMPVVCWQCYMDIDSGSSNFNKYVGCIHDNGSGYLVYTVLLLLALMFMA